MAAEQTASGRIQGAAWKTGLMALLMAHGVMSESAELRLRAYAIK